MLGASLIAGLTDAECVAVSTGVREEASCRVCPFDNSISEFTGIFGSHQCRHLPVTGRYSP